MERWPEKAYFKYRFGSGFREIFLDEGALPEFDYVLVKNKMCR